MMEKSKISVLSVEDNPGDARLVQEMLKEADSGLFDFTNAVRIKDALAILKKQRFDVVLLDLNLPDCRGLDGLDRIVGAEPGVPIVVLTGLDDEATGVRAIEKQAADYLVKGEITTTLLVRSIRYSIERKKAEDRLRESEEKYRRIVETANEGVWATDAERKTVFVNQRMADMLGYTVDEMTGRAASEFLAPGQEQLAFKTREELKAGLRTEQEFKFHRKDGSELWAISNASPVLDAEGRHRGTISMLTDITERKEAEESLKLERSRLAATIENTPVGIAVTDAKGGTIHSNAAFENIWGKPRPQTRGVSDYKKFRAWRADTGRPISPEEWASAAVIRTGRPCLDQILKVQRFDGTYAFIQNSAAPILGDSGEVVGSVVAILDITERKRAEEEIERSRRWLERIAGTTPDIIFVLDIVNNRRVYANRSLIELLGYSPEEFREIDDLPEKVIEPEDLARAAEFYRNMADAQPGEVRVLTHRALHRDGRTLWLENRVTPFTWNADGNLVEVIGISHDVTDLKRAHEVLQRDRETFERLVDERTAELVEIHHELDKARHLSDIGTLASTVAHELRNPLGVIKTAVYNINRKKKGDALDRHLQTINKKIDESNQIINNLLMYARIKPPAYETVRIRELLRENIESAKARTDGRSVTFRYESGSVEDVMATLDPYQITEVMSNILTNAVQAIPMEGGGTVTVSARTSDGMLHIRVSDTGTGIDPDVLPHVFEPFFTSKSKGTGLGLSLCKELVSLHNGSINIESEPGKGTTVTVILPLSPGIRPATTQ